MLGHDLGMGLPFGHGLGAAVVAMRLADRLGADQQTAMQAYYGCLLFYAGCTSDADVQATLSRDGLTETWTLVMFASQRQSVSGLFQLLTERWAGGGPLRRAAGDDLPLPIRFVHVARTPPFRDCCTCR